MAADYLACLAMKLLCSVLSSRQGEGVAEGGCEGAWGRDCVKGTERNLWVGGGVGVVGVD